MILWLILVIFLALFAFVAFVGAPYVPTHKAAVLKALDLLALKPGDVVVDLGSGDGVFLKSVAKRGILAVGYEVNPVLCMIAWVRCWRVRRFVKIKLANFWAVEPPTETKAIYVFLAGPYMERLAGRLQKLMAGRRESLKVVSYGFEIPGFKYSKSIDGLYLYKLDSTKR